MLGTKREGNSTLKFGRQGGGGGARKGGGGGGGGAGGPGAGPAAEHCWRDRPARTLLVLGLGTDRGQGARTGRTTAAGPPGGPGAQEGR